ncbi:hypothetical protein [Singulisphaera sp. PoT]|uniref:hypothetical protein n=1 Tax=Singulisphaera sp. PoT TaxID=3411797 RepID=UPI003BF5E20A
MRAAGIKTAIVTWIGVAIAMGAAPAAPSYRSIEQRIEEIRAEWSKPGVPAYANAPGWNQFFDALSRELSAFAKAGDDNAQLVALNQIYQMSNSLGSVPWKPALELREELRTWLRPRVRLAWAGRRLVDSVNGLQLTSDAEVLKNRQRWIEFAKEDVAGALRRYDAATTVAGRFDALERIYGVLTTLQGKNQTRPWVPSLELQNAINDHFNRTNLDVSADLATVTPFLSNNLVETGPIYRKGYVSQVTAGPKTGFGLLPSGEGISFYNKQISFSETPITDFQQQIEADEQGKRAAKLYYFTATTQDTSEITVIAVIGPDGLHLNPQYSHNINVIINSFPQASGALGRCIAAAIGLNQEKITQKVKEGAEPRIKDNVVKEAAELGGERIAAAQAQKNVEFSKFLVGNRTLSILNYQITELSLQSRPEAAYVGGTFRFKGGPNQVGAYAPQPARFSVPAPGISADLHLSSIVTSLLRGYLQTEPVRDVKNLMVVTRKVSPDAPPGDKVSISQNIDYPTFLKAVVEAEQANDPNVLAIRVKRPDRSPDVDADAAGHLVVLVHGFEIEVPAPPQAARGGLFGPKAKVYRISSPSAEIVISFKVTPPDGTNPLRLTGRIEGFEFDKDAKVFSLNDDETKPVPMPVLTRNLVLNVLRNKIQGQPVDIPFKNLELRGVTIKEVSSLDPSGWIRVNLLRTGNGPPPSPTANP